MSELPDPVGFACRGLEALGGLTELRDGRCSALLPPQLARELDVPEEVLLGCRGGDGAVACGIGSPLMESLVERARGATPVAAVTLAGSAPSASALGALASGYALRNGVVTTASVTSVETWYARLSIAWRVEADERREGLVHVTVAASDGALAAEAFDRRCVPAGAEVEPAQPPSVDHVQVGARFARAAAFPVGSAIAPLLVLTARRQARDHERIAGYYGALLQEVLRPRRKIDPAAAVAKIAHLVSERDRRLADLAQRYTARVSFRLAGVLWVRANAGQVTLLARRRKGQRELRLRVPSGTRVFDRLACEGCDGWADRPALCDGQLHILCERCVPVADGRPVCGGCRGRGTV